MKFLTINLGWGSSFFLQFFYYKISQIFKIYNLNQLVLNGFSIRGGLNFREHPSIM
jgi:hypothetical protein